MIQALLQSGQKHKSNRLMLYWSDDLSEREGGYAAAYLISSNAGGAVERNRIKRWLREDFRRLQMNNGIEGGFIIRFRGLASETDHRTLGGELEKLYKSIRANGK